MRPYNAKALPERPPRYVYTLVRLWQRRLGLQHWTVTLFTRNFKDNTAAEVKWTKDYKGASIHFSKKWLLNETIPDKDRELTVVHELVHLIFADMDDRMEKMMGVGEVFYAYAEAREGMCDVIAARFYARYRNSK
jgi:hypothetical protein